MTHKEQMIAECERQKSCNCPRCGVPLISSEWKQYPKDHTKKECDKLTSKEIHFMEALEGFGNAIQQATHRDNSTEVTKWKSHMANARKHARKLFNLSCGSFHGSGIEKRFEELLGK